MKMNIVFELFYLVSILSIAFAIKPGCVEIYEHCDYQGKAKTVCDNVDSFCKLGLENVISAVKVGPGTSITLFSEDLYLGKRITLSQDMNCLVKVGFNDVASSARISFTAYKPPTSKIAPVRPLQGCILIFEHCNYEGKWEQVCDDLPNLDTVCMENLVSSIKLGQNVHSRLFDARNYAGNTISVTADDKCLVDKNFHAKTSSLKIIKVIQQVVAKGRVSQTPALTPSTKKVNIKVNVKVNSKKKVGRLTKRNKKVKKSKVIVKTQSQMKVTPKHKITININTKITPKVITTKPVAKVKLPTEPKPVLVKDAKSIHPRVKPNVNPQSFPSQIAAPNRPSKGCILVFEHINYKGKWAHVCGSLSKLSTINFGSNISSVKVGYFAKAVFYSNEGFTGQNIAFERDEPNFVIKKFNDAAKSLKLFVYLPKPKVIPVASGKNIPIRISNKIKKAPFRPRRGCVTVFEHIDYKGEWSYICNSIASLKTINFDKKISSLKVGRRTKIIFYSLPDFKGSSIEFSGDEKNFVDKKYNDLASSAKLFIYPNVVVKKKTARKPTPIVLTPADKPLTRPLEKCIRLFEHINYQGRSVEICRSVIDFKKIGVSGFHNIASSVWVGPNTMVDLFENVAYTGRHILIAKDEPNFLNREWLNDKSCSAKIYILKEGKKYEITFSLVRAKRRNKVFPKRKKRQTFSITGQFINAINGKFIENLSDISIIAQGTSGRKYQAKNAGNKFVFNALTEGEYEFTVSSKNYIGFKIRRTLTSENSKVARFWDFTISPTLKPDQWRVVLTWSSVPKDLDSTLVMPDGKEIINFKNRRSKDGVVALDVDDRTGFGPETITIENNHLKNAGDYYSYLVHNYSQTPDITVSSAIVTLYNGSKIIRSWNVPTTGTGLYWHVFNLTSKGAVSVNQIVRAYNSLRVALPTPTPAPSAVNINITAAKGRTTSSTTSTATSTKKYYVNGKLVDYATYQKYLSAGSKPQIIATKKYYVNGKLVDYATYQKYLAARNRVSQSRTTTTSTKKYYVNGKLVDFATYQKYLNQNSNITSTKKYYVNGKLVDYATYQKYLIAQKSKQTTPTKKYYVNGKLVDYVTYQKYLNEQNTQKSRITSTKKYYVNGQLVDYATYQKYLSTSKTIQTTPTKKYYVNGKLVDYATYQRHLNANNNIKSNVTSTKKYYVNGNLVDFATYQKYLNAQKSRQTTVTTAKKYYVNGKLVDYDTYQKYLQAQKTQHKVTINVNHPAPIVNTLAANQQPKKITVNINQQALKVNTLAANTNQQHKITVNVKPTVSRVNTIATNQPKSTVSVKPAVVSVKPAVTLPKINITAKVNPITTPKVNSLSANSKVTVNVKPIAATANSLSKSNSHTVTINVAKPAINSQSTTITTNIKQPVTTNTAQRTVIANVKPASLPKITITPIRVAPTTSNIKIQASPASSINTSKRIIANVSQPTTNQKSITVNVTGHAISSNNSKYMVNGKLVDYATYQKYLSSQAKNSTTNSLSSKKYYINGKEVDFATYQKMMGSKNTTITYSQKPLVKNSTNQKYYVNGKEVDFATYQQIIAKNPKATINTSSSQKYFVNGKEVDFATYQKTMANKNTKTISPKSSTSNSQKYFVNGKEVDFATYQKLNKNAKK